MGVKVSDAEGGMGVSVLARLVDVSTGLGDADAEAGVCPAVLLRLQADVVRIKIMMGKYFIGFMC